MDLLAKFNPIGDAVILVICLFPMAVNLYTLRRPKEERRITKQSIITSFALLLLGFLIIYFRN